MMEVVIQVLACVGGLVVVLGIIALMVNLHDLFERVDRLEVNDNVRRDDIIDIRSQIMRIKEDDYAEQ